MINLIGDNLGRHRVQLDVGVLHDYGKHPRPGRKLGHITVVADSRSNATHLSR